MWSDPEVVSDNGFEISGRLLDYICAAAAAHSRRENSRFVGTCEAAGDQHEYVHPARENGRLVGTCEAAGDQRKYAHPTRENNRFFETRKNIYKYFCGFMESVTKNNRR